MKWVWRIYRINNSFATALEEIGASPFLNLLEADFNFIYAKFDGAREGRWSLSSPEDDNGDILNSLIQEGYEFKGNVGIKQQRKKKLKKIFKDETIH